MQLLYLGKLSRPKYREFSLNVLIFSMLQYWDINCKTVTILFYLLIIQLTVYNRTIKRFIADDKVYQRVRWEMRLASDKYWARRRLRHLSWRSRWIILCKLEQRIAVSCGIHLTEHKVLTRSSLLRDERSLPLPGCRTIVLVLWMLLRTVYSDTTQLNSTSSWVELCRAINGPLSRLSMLPTFPTIVRKFTRRHSCTIPFWQIEILNQNLIFL